MARNVFSFSVKEEDDQKFLEELKVDLIRNGRNFSFYVIQALKDARKKEVSSDVRRAKV